MTVRLLCDLGATYIRFAISESGTRRGKTTSYRCDGYRSFFDAVTTYLNSFDGDMWPTEASFAVAAPITGDLIELTNRPWQFSIRELKKTCKIPRLSVINDFSAIALALPWLDKTDRRKIGTGRPEPKKPLGVIGAGSGLGSSGLIAGPKGWIPLAGEGGYTDFAPKTEEELSVFFSLGGPSQHVAVEHVLSGPGLVAIHKSLWGQSVPCPKNITERAIEGDYSAIRTLDMFSQILGSAAGNLALSIGARGGVFIAGGIVPKLGSHFNEKAFRKRFESKGSLSPYLKQIPTYLITTENPALIGLEHYSL